MDNSSKINMQIIMVFTFACFSHSDALESFIGKFTDLFPGRS
jgi:hypothetical protein